MTELPPDLALVINLASATDRRTFQERQLTERGIPFRILPATSVADIEPAEMERLRRTWARPLRATEVCCTLSHRRAWEVVRAEDRPRLILEDDAILSRQVSALLGELLWRDGLEFVTFESYHLPKLLARERHPLETRPFSLSRLYRDRGGAAAYLLWPQAAEKLLAATRHVIPLADAAIDETRGLVRHQLEPAAAIQAQQLPRGQELFGSVGYSNILVERLPDYRSRVDWLRFRPRRIAAALGVLVRRLRARNAEVRQVTRADDIGTV